MQTRLRSIITPAAPLVQRPASQRHGRCFVAVQAVGEGVPIAASCAVAMVGLGAAYIATDPQKRREDQIQQSGKSEMETVREYFNGDGFDRWKRIYGTADDVNKVQKDIRDGHAITIDKVLTWLNRDAGSVKGRTVCDAGCGTGSLAIPLSLGGADVTASDISQAMVEEAQARFQATAGDASIDTAPKFEAKDLESITGQYDIVACLDVMIHYPQEKADDMIAHLASISKEKLIISFAPKTPYYLMLKRIGELFPGPSKATRAYLHAESDVEASLVKAGFRVVNREMTATNFYFSRLLEAVRV